MYKLILDTSLFIYSPRPSNLSSAQKLDVLVKKSMYSKTWNRLNQKGSSWPFNFINLGDVYMSTTPVRASFRTIQTDARCHNIVACCWGLLANNVGPKSLTGFKPCTTSANIVVVPYKRTQHVGPNNVAYRWPTMLRPFAWAFTFTCALALA